MSDTELRQVIRVILTRLAPTEGFTPSNLVNRDVIISSRDGLVAQWSFNGDQALDPYLRLFDGGH
jgi:hypothetical protein